MTSSCTPPIVGPTAVSDRYVLVLNGPSSAGKTTLALALKERLAPRIAAVSLDAFYPFMHPLAENNWHMFATLTEATFTAAATFARRGFSVVVDTVFERKECHEIAQHALQGLAFHLVAVTCSLELLEAREAARGDRRKGQARRHHATVLRNATHDLQLDTGDSSVDECCDEVVAFLESRESSFSPR